MSLEKHTQPYVTIQDVVLSYLNEKFWSIDEKFKPLLRIAVEGLQSLNIFHGKAVKRYSSAASTANIMEAPTDMVGDPIAVGIVENGILRPITPKDEVYVSEQKVELEYQVDTALTNKQPIPVGTWFTVGGGWNDVYYKYYGGPDERFFVFQGYVQNKVIGVEYTSSGVVVSGTTWVPIEMMAVIKSYIEWVIRKRNDMAPENKVQSAKKDYVQQLDIWHSFNESLSPEEYKQIIRSGYSQGPHV